MSDDTKRDFDFNPLKYEGHTPGPWFRDKYASLTVMGHRRYGGVSQGVVASCGGFNSNTDAEEVGQESLTNARLIADAPHLLDDLVKAKAEVERLRKALQAASRAMNVEWVKYYERDRPAPASLKEAVNRAIRVLGEEGGGE